WIPPKDRSLAFGIFNTGSAVGAIVAVFSVTRIAAAWGWRWAFFLSGACGFLWAVLWVIFYARPSESRFAGEAERAELARALGAPNPDAESPALTWTQLFKHRELWGIMAAKFVSDAAWY